MPKASAPGPHQRNGRQNYETLRSNQALEGFCNQADFFGASPVASALGLPLGRDPSRKIEWEIKLQ